MNDAVNEYQRRHTKLHAARHTTFKLVDRKPARRLGFRGTTLLPSELMLTLPSILQTSPETNRTQTKDHRRTLPRTYQRKQHCSRILHNGFGPLIRRYQSQRSSFMRTSVVKHSVASRDRNIGERWSWLRIVLSRVMEFPIRPQILCRTAT